MVCLVAVLRQASGEASFSQTFAAHDAATRLPVESPYITSGGTMITIVARLQAVEGKQDELRAVLTEMVGNVSRHEKGAALAYSLHTSDSDPTLFMFYEQYSGPEALEAHGKTAHMAEMGGKLRGLLAGRPVIERYTQIAGV
jgi:quinol monooxygenase YgiN